MNVYNLQQWWLQLTKIEVLMYKTLNSKTSIVAIYKQQNLSEIYKSIIHEFDLITNGKEGMMIEP